MKPKRFAGLLSGGFIFHFQITKQLLSLLFSSTSPMFLLQNQQQVTERINFNSISCELTKKKNDRLTFITVLFFTFFIAPPVL